MYKPTKRKAFNFLRSYFDVVNELQNDKDKVDFLMAVINKQFLDEDPKDLSFVVNLCYASQKHAIESSVKGYLRTINTDIQGNPQTDPTTIPMTTPPTIPMTIPKEEKEEEQVQEKVEVKEKEDIDSRKLKFAHTLKEFSNIYSREMLKEFYDYWTETNDNGKKFRREMQRTWNLKRRLETWFKNENKFNTKKQSNEKLNIITTEIRNYDPTI